MNATKVIDEKYEIRDEIKRGGFGIIYQGVDLLFGKPVAIKAVEPALLHEAKYIDMFQAEALSIARLNHHNIVHIYDIKRDEGGQFYIVMEYIDGCDLAQLLRACRKSKKPLPLHLGVYIIAETCAGLDYAHNRRDAETNSPLNVVHQDITPSNIMLTQNGDVKVIDFGMAQFYRKQVLKKNEVSIQGKINYLAPEQLNGGANIDRRTDIFALGLVLYELITGERFFKADNPQQNIEMLRSNKWDFSKIENDNVPKKLREVIQKSVRPKVEDRYPSANHIYMDLMHYLILAAPAADFSGELAEFVQKLDVRSQLEKQSAPGESSVIDAKTESNNHVPKVEQKQGGASKDGLKSTAKEGKIEPVHVSENGIQEPKAAPKAKDAKKQKPDDFEEKERVSTKEFMEISDKTVDKLKEDETSEATGAQTGKNAAKTNDDKGKTKAASPREETKDDGPLLTETVEMEKPKTKSSDDVETQTIEKSTDSFDKLDLANILKDEEQKSPPKSDPDTKELERQTIKSTAAKTGSAEFYSIIDDTESEEDELKTIIDVVRLSARSHKKGILVTLVSLFLLFVAYTIADTTMQFTSYGTFMYDMMSPPAIKISSVPSGAQVYLDDQPLQQTTPIRIEKIEPGVHKLMLVLPRFEPIVKSINVPSEGKLQVAGEDSRNPWEDYTFQFKTQLELSSNPPDADIFINGVKLAQTTPATVLWDVTEEPIQITLAKPGFPNLTGMEINTLEGAETISDRRFWKFQRLDRNKDHFAIEGVFRKTIEILSNPSQAEIYLNEEERPVGITELNGTLLLPVGQHVITLSKNGYLSRKFTISVDENTESRFSQVLSRNVQIYAKDALSPDNSDLGATLVELRTQRQTLEIGKETPTEVTLLPYRYTAVLRKKGFEETFVQISPTDRRVVAEMNPETAQVTVFIIDEASNEPVNATQVVCSSRDGGNTAQQQLGISDATGTVIGDLPPGNYQFSVIKPGYEVATKNLRIRGDQRNRLTFKLTVKK